MHMHAGSSPAWGTVLTGPLASLLTLSFFVLSRQCLKMRVLGVEVGGIMFASSAQPQPVKWPQLINCSLSCLFLLSYNTS